MDVAFELTDRVTVLHFGKVVADGLGETVKADPLVQEIYLGAPAGRGPVIRPAWDPGRHEDFSLPDDPNPPGSGRV